MRHKGFIKYSNNAANLHLEIDQLCAAGVKAENISVLESIDPIVEALGKGDHIVVYSLAEVSTGVLGLLRILHEITLRGATLSALDAPWLDMKKQCPWPEILQGLTDFGSQVVSERTKKALSKVKASGTRLGRPPRISEKQLRKYEIGIQMYQETTMSLRAICRAINVDISSFSRYIKKNRPDLKREKKKDTDKGQGQGQEKLPQTTYNI